MLSEANLNFPVQNFTYLSSPPGLYVWSLSLYLCLPLLLLLLIVALRGATSWFVTILCVFCSVTDDCAIVCISKQNKTKQKQNEKKNAVFSVFPQISLDKVLRSSPAQPPADNQPHTLSEPEHTHSHSTHTQNSPPGHSHKVHSSNRSALFGPGLVLTSVSSYNCFRVN